MAGWRVDENQVEVILGHEDGLVIVLKAHMLLEQLLSEYIRVRLPTIGNETLNRLRFGDQVALASALGAFPESSRAAYMKVNNLRNALAHELDRDVLPADEKAIFESLAPEQGGLDGLAVLHRNPEAFPSTLRTVLATLIVQIGGALPDTQPSHDRNP
jgi:hypothetical protein